jgi:hypothetical protein
MMKRHLPEKKFHSKARDNDFLSVAFLTCPFSSYSREINLIAAETPLAEKIFSFESQIPTSY